MTRNMSVSDAKRATLQLHLKGFVTTHVDELGTKCVCETHHLKQMKKSVIEMHRDDAGWCGARAIITARRLSLAGQWTNPRRVTRMVMAPSLKDYKIVVVVDASNAYWLVATGHGDHLLALLYDDHHYDTLTSLKGFLGHSYLCLVCLKGYDARGTKGNIVAVVCKRTATNTKPLIGPTARPTC